MLEARNEQLFLVVNRTSLGTASVSPVNNHPLLKEFSPCLRNQVKLLIVTMDQRSIRIGRFERILS